jgi:branched-chain amino acid transport system ATP-binding protein
VNSALTVKDLSLNIGGAKILDGITLDVARNETLGIIGPNGAGKTSFFNLLSGIRKPSRGQIFVGDIETTNFAPHECAQAGIARTFQTSSVFVNLTCLENVRIAAQAANGQSMNLTKNAYKFTEVVQTAHDCLAKVGLSARAMQRAGSLSHGDKRRLEIAIVLASQSDIVLLDEPMAGMSV